MQLFPVTPVLIVLWAIMAFRGTDRALAFSICLLPFGMLAAFSLPALGDLSLLAVHVTASLTIALIVAATALAAVRGEPMRVPAEALALGAYVAYGVISAFILVRLFEGEFSVFSLSRSADGVAVSVFFRSMLTPLRPGNSNLSQAAYLIISFAFFVACWAMIRRRGLAYFENILRIIAIVNAVLGTMDMLGLDPVLSVVRTATYELANSQMSAGMPRIIGGYPEPSSFGSFSAVIFGYFAAAYLVSGRRIDGGLALLCLAFALASLAASAFIALAGSSLFLAFLARGKVFGRFPRGASLMVGLGLCLIMMAGAIIVIATPIPEFVEKAVREIIFDKAGSESGLERGAWAANGLVAFRETFGLGAGVGSLRSNGLVSVVLGSVGIPGALALGAFLVAAFVRPLRAEADEDAVRVFAGARAAAVAQLSAMLASATVPDPGLPLLLFAAAAVVCRGFSGRAAIAPRTVPLRQISVSAS